MENLLKKMVYGAVAAGALYVLELAVAEAQATKVKASGADADTTKKEAKKETSAPASQPVRVRPVKTTMECMPGEKYTTTVIDSDGEDKEVTFTCPVNGKKRKTIKPISKSKRTEPSGDLIGIRSICGTEAFNIIFSGKYKCLTPQAAGELKIPYTMILEGQKFSKDPKEWCPGNTLCYKLPETKAAERPKDKSAVKPITAPATQPYRVLTAQEIGTSPKPTKWSLEGILDILTNGSQGPDVAVGVQASRYLGKGFSLGVRAGYLGRTVPVTEGPTSETLTERTLNPDNTTYRVATETTTTQYQESGSMGLMGARINYDVTSWLKAFVGVDGIFGSAQKTTTKELTTQLERNGQPLGSPKTTDNKETPLVETKTVSGAYPHAGLQACKGLGTLGSADVSACASAQVGYDSTQNNAKGGVGFGIKFGW